MKASKPQKIIEKVSEILAPKLLNDGFELDLKVGAFYRQRNLLTQYLFLKSHRLPLGLYRVTFNSGIRSDEVEEVFWKCESQLQFHENSCTLLQVCLNVGPPRFPVQGFWTIDDEFHVCDIADELKSFANGYILPWFEKYNSLTAIFNALIEKYYSSDLDHDTSKSYERALIVAAILKERLALARLVERVNGKLKSFPPSYPKQFEEFYTEVRSMYPEFLPEYSTAFSPPITST